MGRSAGALWGSGVSALRAFPLVSRPSKGKSFFSLPSISGIKGRKTDTHREFALGLNKGTPMMVFAHPPGRGPQPSCDLQSGGDELGPVPLSAPPHLASALPRAAWGRGVRQSPAAKVWRTSPSWLRISELPSLERTPAPLGDLSPAEVTSSGLRALNGNSDNNHSSNNT